MTDREMRGFEDLECHQLAMQVFREGYRVASLLPTEEKYDLADQLRRAATSVVLNIAGDVGAFIIWTASFLLHRPRFHHGNFERVDCL